MTNLRLKKKMKKKNCDVVQNSMDSNIIDEAAGENSITKRVRTKKVINLAKLPLKIKYLVKIIKKTKSY